MKTDDSKTDSEFAAVPLTEPANLHACCRICLGNDEDQINIFNETSTVATMLSYFVNFEVYEGDGLPPKICRSCHDKLYISYYFYLKCQETEALFYQLFESQNPESSSSIVTIEEGVKDDQLLIEALKKTDSCERLKFNGETTNSLADSKDEENVPSFESQEQIREDDNNISNSVSPPRHFARIGSCMESTSHATIKSNVKDKHDNPQSLCHKTEPDSSGSRLCEPNISIVYPSKKTISSNAHNVSEAFTVDKEDNANDDISYMLSCVEIDTNVVNGEEVTLVELFPENEDCQEFDYRLEHTMGGHSELETGEIVEFSDCHKVSDPSHEACYGLFSDECLKDVEDDHRVVQHKTAKNKTRRRNNERVDVRLVSGPIRMELHPACISVCDFECRLCGETFMHRSDLKYHETLHSRRQGLECSVCYKHFSCNYKLEEHMRIHTGVKPYTCAICDTSFTQRGALQNHMKKHSKARPYACSECGRSYYNREGLQVHMRLHKSDPLDIDLNECPLCDKAFVYPSGLSRHLALHSSRSFTCDLCQKNFRELPSLKRHMRKKHGFG